MIYCGYTLAYVPRVCMLRRGYWNELQLLYHAVGRYHVLPLMGLAAILAAVIAACPLARRWDSCGRRPAIVGALVGLIMLAAQFAEASYWDFYLLPQDQKTTFAALHRLGQLAREEGISRSARANHRSRQAPLERVGLDRPPCVISAGQARCPRPQAGQPPTRRRRGA